MTKKEPTKLHQIADEFDGLTRFLVEHLDFPGRMAQAAREELMEGYEAMRAVFLKNALAADEPQRSALLNVLALHLGQKRAWEKDADRHAEVFKRLLRTHIAAAISDFLDVFFSAAALHAAQGKPTKEQFIDDLKEKLFKARKGSLEHFPFYDGRGQKAHHVPFLFIKFDLALRVLPTSKRLTWKALADCLNGIYSTDLTAYKLRRAAAHDGYTMAALKKMRSEITKLSSLKK
jgi:hypothetical protein